MNSNRAATGRSTAARLSVRISWPRLADVALAVFDRPSSQPDDIVILGQLPPSLHTHGTRVAHSRSGFIAPTAPAGGDALPLHDTAVDRYTDRKFSPTEARPDNFDPRQRETVQQRTLGATDTAEVTTLIDTTQHRPTRQKGTEQPRRRRLPRWFPWSVLVSLAGIAAVRLASLVTGDAGGMVSATALLATAFCGVLLVIAQLIAGTTK